MITLYVKETGEGIRKGIGKGRGEWINAEEVGDGDGHGHGHGKGGRGEDDMIRALNVM